jgi:hypothetical protein
METIITNKSATSFKMTVTTWNTCI